LRQTSSVLYLAVDALIPARGKAIAGLDEFMAGLDHAGIPVVWVSSRTRLQLDDPRRKAGHTHPFIAEDGCGAYLPEDYFHLRPDEAIRLGRFTCIPVAKRQPAAAEALEDLAEAAGVEAVPFRSLSPRELAQNSGLPSREAELVRQPDFDELFFLAGASDADVARLKTEAQNRKLQLREHGVLWSLAVGASLKTCVKELTKLYDRALRYHAASVAIAPSLDAQALFPACDRQILLTETWPRERDDGALPRSTAAARGREFYMRAPNLWGELSEFLIPRKA
jgi:predicted mannosyl-3-phosphoglycerate phosphatase (HAD superfamily)